MREIASPRTEPFSYRTTWLLYDVCTLSSVVRYYRGMLTTWSSLIVCSFMKRRTGQNSVGVIKALLVKDPRLSRPVYLLSSTILYIIIFLMMKIGSHDNGLFQESILNSALNNWDKLLIESPS